MNGNFDLVTKIPYAITVLVSAFLLFIVQPLIAKVILPWFGGSPGVWTISLLFFQLVLLAGYSYAHFMIRFLQPRTQMVVHITLLMIAVLLLPIIPSPEWKPDDPGMPTLRILLLLTSSVGVQYFMVTTTAPLVQAWFARDIPGYSVYRLYALSNVGSIVALVSYPFVIEPGLTLLTQQVIWSWGFGLFVVASGYCAIRQWNNSTSRIERSVPANSPGGVTLPKGGVKFLWFALSAAGSVMLLAVTNHVSRDIAVIPMLWVIPLSLYLLSFAICFDHEQWYFRRMYAVAFVVITALFALILEGGLGDILQLLNIRGITAEIKFEIILFVAGLFIFCMVCHGELARLKPPPCNLTVYYLSIAAGGVIGGLFVAVLSPLLFEIYLELQIGILVSCLLVMMAWFRDKGCFLYRGRPRWTWALLLAGFATLTTLLAQNVENQLSQPLMVDRNFYGVVRVVERYKNHKMQHRLQLQQSGMTEGIQYVLPQLKSEPTSYYSHQSGIGRLLESYPANTAIRVGAIGLGVGTVAVYGRKGDYYRFYEINPKIIELSHTMFSYLEDSKADIDIIPGDARLSLEREPLQEFDVLILDAFRGDAIPVHLLTSEAFEQYLRHLKPSGVLAVHTSNELLELMPVVWKAAKYNRLEMAYLLNTAEPGKGVNGSEWFLLTRNEEILHRPLIRAAAVRGHKRINTMKRQYADFRMWSDDYSNLFQIMYKH